MPINEHLNRVWLVMLATLAVLIPTGCRSTAPSPMTCRVLIDGVPVLEVRLVLLHSHQGELKPVLEGISDSSGTIAMKFLDGAELPTDAELELTAVIESVGGGDWQLNAPWSNPQRTPLKVKWPPSQGAVEIVLPRKAIRAI